VRPVIAAAHMLKVRAGELGLPAIISRSMST
jgi:hypothetical protein